MKQKRVYKALRRIVWIKSVVDSVISLLYLQWQNNSELLQLTALSFYFFNNDNQDL